MKTFPSKFWQKCTWCKQAIQIGNPLSALTFNDQTRYGHEKCAKKAFKKLHNITAADSPKTSSKNYVSKKALKKQQKALSEFEKMSKKQRYHQNEIQLSLNHCQHCRKVSIEARCKNCGTMKEQDSIDGITTSAHPGNGNESAWPRLMGSPEQSNVQAVSFTDHVSTTT